MRVNFIYKNMFNYIYTNTNYLILCIIQTINIIFGILLFKKMKNQLIYILYTIFLIITLFIPVYSSSYTYAPIGEKSEYMGLAIGKQDLNIYGINIRILNNDRVIS